MTSHWKRKKKTPASNHFWVELPAPKSRSVRFSPVLINESIFLSSDYDEGEKGLVQYHCGLNTLVQSIKYPPVFRPIGHSIAATNQNDIVLVDGVNGKVAVLNVETMTYSHAVAIPTLGPITSCLVIKGNVHIIGGNQNLEDQYLIYSINTNTVKVLNNKMNESNARRIGSVSFTKRDDDSEFYKFGGFDWEKEHFSDTFCVGKLQNDDAKKPIIWKESPQFKLKKPLHSCGVIQHHSYIITFGGRTKFTKKCSEINDIYILNTRSNTGWIKSGIRCPVKGQYVAVLDHQQRVHLFTRWRDPTKHYCIPLKALLPDQGQGSQDVPSCLQRARVSFNDSQRIRQLQDDEKESVKIREKESIKIKDENAIFKAMNESLNDELQRTSKENESWRMEVLSLKKTNQDLIQRLHEFERCNVVMQRDNEELTAEIKQRMDTVHTLNDLVAKRQDALNAVNERTKQLNAELNAMKRNEVTQRSVLKGLMKENKRLKKEQKVLQKTIDELNGKVIALEMNALNPSEFMQWDWKQIHLWIMKLETGRFKQYDSVLRTALSRGNLHGEDLLLVNPLVMKYWGISHSEDREALSDQIQKLMTEGS